MPARASAFSPYAGFSTSPKPSMRFKATILPSHFPSFWAHITLAERVGKRAVLVLSAASVRITVTSESDTVMMYSAIDTPAVFDSFRCESRSDNVIAIEVEVANLVAGLQPSSAVDGPSSEGLTLKLTKRDAAQYLRAEARPRKGGAGLVQDIPVRVVVGAEMLRFAPPQLPQPAVSVFLPSPRVLRAVVERARALGRGLSVEATAPGDGATVGATLTLGVDHDLVRTRVAYRNIGCEAASRGRAACLVGIKDFARTLRGVADVAESVSIAVKLAIVPGVALLVNAALEDGSGTVVLVHTVGAQVDQGGEEEEEAAAAEEEEERGGAGGGGGGGGAAAEGGEGGGGG